MRSGLGRSLAARCTTHRGQQFGTAAAVAAVAAMSLLLAAGAQARPQTPTARLGLRCTTVTGPDIYGQWKGADRYGVYVMRGRVTCGTAEHIVSGDIHNKGVIHNGNPPLGDYRSYDGWVCPGGQMGYEYCQHSSRPVAQPRTEVLSVDCNRRFFSQGCPATLPLN
jgi:hypothetical protein